MENFDNIPPAGSTTRKVEKELVSQANDVEEPHIDVGSSGRNYSPNIFKTSLQPQNLSCATNCLPSGQVFQPKTGFSQDSTQFKDIQCQSQGQQLQHVHLNQFRGTSMGSPAATMVLVQPRQSPPLSTNLALGLRKSSTDFKDIGSPFFKPTAPTTGPLDGVQPLLSKMPTVSLSKTNLALGPDEEKKKDEGFNRSSSDMTLTADPFGEVPPDGSSKKIDEEGEEEAVHMSLIEKSRWIEKFPCLFCGKGFVTKCEERKHWSDCHDGVEMKLKCYMCAYTCSGSRKNMVKNHIMVNHPNTKERFYTIIFERKK